jgi:hypothetical protein
LTSSCRALDLTSSIFIGLPPLGIVFCRAMEPLLPGNMRPAIHLLLRVIMYSSADEDNG